MALNGRVLAMLSALALVLASLAPAEAASRGGHGGGGGHSGGGGHGGHRGGHGHGHGGHWHGGRWCCWGGGFYAFPFIYPYPYPYPYGYPGYADPVVAQPPGAYQQQLQVGSPPPAVQREVVYPHGKYVLYGDGVTQPWQWVWVPAESAPPPTPR